ncbi:MAG: cullin, partial [Candidatus Pacebacteria bacterium]|nr:cullin [Candidatus Paceibacterota bacterium]
PGSSSWLTDKRGMFSSPCFDSNIYWNATAEYNISIFKAYRAKLDDMKWNFVENIRNRVDTGTLSIAKDNVYVRALQKVKDISDCYFRDDNNMAVVNILKDVLSGYGQRFAMPKVGKEILTKFSHHLKSYTLLAYWISKVFSHLEREYLGSNKEKTLAQMALSAFQSVVVKKSLAIVEIFRQFKAEDGVLEWQAIKRGAKCLRILNMTDAIIIEDDLSWVGQHDDSTCVKKFEARYIKVVANYYAEESKKWIDVFSCPEYVKKATDALKKEEERGNYLLSAGLCTQLMGQIENSLIVLRAQELIEKDRAGVADLIKQKRTEELRALTLLLLRRPQTFRPVADKFMNHVVTCGKAIEQNKEIVEDPVGYMTKMLELKREMDVLITNGFAGNEVILETNDRAFKSVLNEFELAPKFLAIYVDYLMRQGLKGQESMAEALVSEAFSILKMLTAQDAFTLQHQSLYGTRLLQGASISDDAEELLICKIKAEFGIQHVFKYVKMANDIKTSREIVEGFRRSKQGTTAMQGVEFGVKVLTSGLWQCEHNAKCRLPEDLNSCFNRFEEFYKLAHAGRNISCVVGSGDCEVKALIYPKPYIFVLTTCQASILMLYNKNDSYTYEQLLADTQLSPDVMHAQISGLINPRLGRLLMKENIRSQKCDLKEKIRLNTGYIYSSLKIALVPVTQHKMTVEEYKEIGKGDEMILKKQRAVQIQSVAMKIMKDRRRVSHNELISESIKQITCFKAEPTFVKQQIEWLIESDYMMRDEKDKAFYIYAP